MDRPHRRGHGRDHRGDDGGLDRGRVFCPPPASVQQVLDAVSSKPLYVHSLWGYEVTDQATRAVVLAENVDKTFVTGSILKLYSTATALDALGPDHRFRTPVHRRGRLSRGTLAGDLVLVASGEFSFACETVPTAGWPTPTLPTRDRNYADTGLAGAALVPHNHPLAAVNRLARQVRAAGIRRVRGDFVIDDRLSRAFDGWPDGCSRRSVSTRTSSTSPRRRPRRGGRPGSTGGRGRRRWRCSRGCARWPARERRWSCDPHARASCASPERSPSRASRS